LGLDTNRGLDTTGALDTAGNSMNRSSVSPRLFSASREPIAANVAVMMEGASEEP
jgi:hypothetical protein